MAADITNFLATMPMYGTALNTTMANNNWSQQQAADALSGAYNQALGSGNDPQHAWQGAWQSYLPGQASPYALQPHNNVFGSLASINPGLSTIAKAYQSAYDLANNANINQAAQINSGYANLFQQMMGTQQQNTANLNQGYGNLLSQANELQQGLGTAARQRITDQYQQAQGQAQQSLQGRGLGNTTVTDSVRRGLIADESKAYQSLDEQLRQERLGYTTQIGGNQLAAQQQQGQQQLGVYNVPLAQLGFQNSITNQGPDLGAFAQLAGQLGQQKTNWWQNALSFGAPFVGQVAGSALGKLF